jgi:ubiquinone/menaquinone biosynthesis C-methylase UbiE
VGFYQDRIVPHLVNMSMRQESLAPYRRRVAGAAEGRVLEIGVGSGMNLPLYGERVTHVIGLDPSPKLLSMTEDAANTIGRTIELLQASAEAIPLDDDSVDTVVTTWTLCTIPEVTRALAEMRRVLRPTGHLVFVEHGRSPDPNVTWWQDRLTPLWKRIGGGCHLNRPIRQLLETSGFAIERLDTGYMKGPKPLTFMYEGRARNA